MNPAKQKRGRVFAKPPSRYSGVLCHSNSGKIDSCKLTGEGEGKNLVSETTSCELGGMTHTNSGVIQNCVNEVNLTAKYYIGGIAAKSIETIERDAIIENCANFGKITSNIGGIIGRVKGDGRNC